MENLISTTVKDRLIEFIDYKRLNKHRFEMMCGFSSRYVSNIQKSISPERLEIIANTFPELNIEWLTTGRGSMIKEAQSFNVHHNSVGDNSQQTILAGSQQSIMTTQEKGQYVINEIRKMEQENIDLKAENAALKAKVEMLSEQIDWLRSLVNTK